MARTILDEVMAGVRVAWMSLGILLVPWGRDLS